MNRIRNWRVIVALAAFAIGSVVVGLSWGGGSASAVDISPTFSAKTPGGHYQARLTTADPCKANRRIKVKRVGPGVDKVAISGLTNTLGVYKQHREFAPGQRKFYAQVYPFTPSGQGYSYTGPTRCLGGKSARRSLPNFK